eukprot:1186712-Prorocentrum_minimum.AAC.2
MRSVWLLDGSTVLPVREPVSFSPGGWVCRGDGRTERSKPSRYLLYWTYAHFVAACAEGRVEACGGEFTCEEGGPPAKGSSDGGRKTAGQRERCASNKASGVSRVGVG